MSLLLYNLLIRAFGVGLGVAAWFNPKARSLRRGRRGLLRRIEQRMSELLPEGGETRGSIWVHCASLGEFEQGRPIIEALRGMQEAEVQGEGRMPIIVTFFSPSGYQVRKEYAGADAVFYLPADTPRNARRFVAALRPRMAIFVKYEYWYNYLRELDAVGVPAHVVSAIFRPDMVFFRNSGAGRFMRRTLGLLKHFFVQNQASAALLEGIGIEAARVSVSGDTRFDRVWSLAQGAPPLPLVEAFVGGRQRWTMVCGSTWPADEELILRLIESPAGDGIKIIVAPHEIDTGRINAFMNRAGSAVRYTDLMGLPEAERVRVAAEAKLLVVDTIGLLSSIYRYGQVAYIGGGFGRGIHNTLEAATWGVPVLFGPNYQAFAEAVELVGLGAGEAIGNEQELIAAISRLRQDEPLRERRGQIARTYVQSHAGATQLILDNILSIHNR